MKNNNRSLVSLLALLVCLVGCGVAATAFFVPGRPAAQTLPAEENAYAADSAFFATAQWETTEYSGFSFKSLAVTDNRLFNSNQYFTLIEVPAGSPRRLAFAFAPDTLLPTSELALRTDAVAAVNGSFFDMSLFNPICYLRIDGREVGINTPGKTDTVNRKYYQYASLRLHDGKPRLFVPDSNRFAERSRPDSNIMTAGPMLIWRGKLVPQRQDRTFVTYRHNRTAIGVRRDGSFIILAADGRFKNYAAGLSLDELALVLKWLGCYNAINLDGGGSTTMFVRGRANLGIVNHPSDNGRFDFKGERPVSNAVLLL